MNQETFQPQWAELKESYENALKLLEEQHRATEGQDDRWRALASLREYYIGEFERALWRSEQEYAQLLDKPPVRNARIVREADWILRLAALDQEEALVRQREGRAPDPRAICGVEGMSQREAVRRAVMKVDARKKQTAAELNEHADRHLDAALEAYKRAKRKTRKR